MKTNYSQLQAMQLCHDTLYDLEPNIITHRGGGEEEKKLRLVFLGFIIAHVHEMESHNIPIFSSPKAAGAVTKTTSTTSPTPFRPFTFWEHFQMNLVCPSFPMTLMAINSSTPFTDHTRWIWLLSSFLPNIRLRSHNPRWLGKWEMGQWLGGPRRRQTIETHSLKLDRHW